jgi:glyoxalase family protein
MGDKSQPEILRHHHITLCVGSAQEDYDFHTKVLSLKSVKKTALYDGNYPIRHFYYGNDLGEESTLVTCFPMKQSGRKGRKGSGQIRFLRLSVPVSSLDFWEKRLKNFGFRVVQAERFGERTLQFQHPCGIDYEMVGVADDNRKPYSNGDVPAELAIRGTYGITVGAWETESSDEFMHLGWSARRIATDGKHTRYVLGEGGPGRIVDIVHEPGVPQSSWTFGEGIIHHCAFQVADFDVQDAVKANLEGLGFTDVSERKDRGYFSSIYVRTPSGAMFEATVSKPEGMLIDEKYEDLGKCLQIPPVFADRAAEITKFLDQEPLTY